MDIALSSLRYAFQSVKENRGCAGVDRVSIGQFEENLDLNLQVLQEMLRLRRYRPLPLMKVLIPRKNKTPRMLCIPAVSDRIIQKAVLNLIDPILDKEFEDCSFAYRKGYSVKRAACRIRAYYDEGYHYIIDADIDDFFDNMDHDILMEKFEQVIENTDIHHLVRLWIKTAIWDGDELKAPEKGIPQGSPISPVLANLFLDEIDERIAAKKHKYIRYADNYLLMGKSPEEAEEALELSTCLLDRLDLDLEVENISSFDRGFTYLGLFFFNGMVMKRFDTEEKEAVEPIFPKPFDLAAWRRRNGE